MSAVLLGVSLMLVAAGVLFMWRALRRTADTRFPSLETLVGGLFLVVLGLATSGVAWLFLEVRQ